MEREDKERLNKCIKNGYTFDIKSPVCKYCSFIKECKKRLKNGS
jgi:hypothetical protein